MIYYPLYKKFVHKLKFHLLQLYSQVIHLEMSENNQFLKKGVLCYSAPIAHPMYVLFI